MKKYDISLRKGSSRSIPIMWESRRLIYRSITSIQNTAPVRVTCPGHGLPDGWMVAVANAKGLVDLNATGNPPKDHEFRQATYVDPDTIEFNKVNGSAFRGHQANTGHLVYYEPVLPVVGLKARMQIKNKVGGTVLYELTTENGGITLDAVLKRITLDFPADAFVGAAWKAGVYDLETEDPSGVVTPILYGAFALTDEVTTTI